MALEARIHSLEKNSDVNRNLAGLERSGLLSDQGNEITLISRSALVRVAGYHILFSATSCSSSFR